MQKKSRARANTPGMMNGCETLRESSLRLHYSAQTEFCQSKPKSTALFDGGTNMPSKQKNGLYRTKIKIGVDADGKDIVKWISGKTKAELEKARQEVIARYIDCTALNEDRLFGEYAVEW